LTATFAAFSSITLGSGSASLSAGALGLIGDPLSGTLGRYGAFRAKQNLRTCPESINSDGTRLYASNTGDTSISVFDTTSPLDPVEIQHLKLQGQGNSFEIELDPTGNFLYAITQRASATTALGQGNTLHVLRVDRETGKVDEDESPLRIKVPNGVRPQGVAVVELSSDSR
jgi:hypothetical protein